MGGGGEGLQTERQEITQVTAVADGRSQAQFKHTFGSLPLFDSAALFPSSSEAISCLPLFSLAFFFFSFGNA